MLVAPLVSVNNPSVIAYFPVAGVAATKEDILFMYVSSPVKSCAAVTVSPSHLALLSA